MLIIGVVITASIADDLICLGEEVVYTCVTQSTTLRWHVKKEGVVTLESIFSLGQQAGSINVEGPYRFTLISNDNNHIESTVSVVTSSSMHNTVLECGAGSLRDTVTIRIAGYYIVQ